MFVPRSLVKRSVPLRADAAVDLRDVSASARSRLFVSCMFGKRVGAMARTVPRYRVSRYRRETVALSKSRISSLRPCEPNQIHSQRTAVRAGLPPGRSTSHHTLPSIHTSPSRPPPPPHPIPSSSLGGLCEAAAATSSAPGTHRAGLRRLWGGGSQRRPRARPTLPQHGRQGAPKMGRSRSCSGMRPLRSSRRSTTRETAKSRTPSSSKG